MSRVKEWFHKEFICRSIAAVIWPCLIQIPLIFLLRVTLSFSLTPSFSFGNVFSVSLVFQYLLLCAILSLMGLTHYSFYTVAPRVNLSRWDAVKNFVSPTFLLLVGLLEVASLLAVSTYMKLTESDIATWTKQCSKGTGTCLNETYLFSILFGLYLGAVLAYDYFWNDERSLKFPVLNLPIRPSVQNQLKKLVLTSLRTSTRHYFTFIFIYFILGGSIRSQLAFSLGLAEDPGFLDTLKQFVNLWLAFRTILVGAVWIFSFKLSLLYFQQYQFKYVLFPVQRYTGEPVAAPLLSEALASCENQLLNLWACRDFSSLGEQSISRRAEIFQVSVPGNHPHNWNALCGTVLPLLEKFLAKLTGNVNEVPPKVEEPVIKSPVSAASPSQLRLRRLASPVDSNAASSFTSENKIVPLSDKLLAKLKDARDQFMKKPLLQQLFGEFPDARQRQIFAASQHAVWLVEGLSHIVAASYSEDSYGVLQKDLPRIMSVLLDIDSALDIRTKGPDGYGKSFPGPPRDVVLKKILKWTVRSSLYRIINKFGQHILNVDVKQDHRRLLQQYLDYNKN